ncbi:MAG: CehA/McbA family metallohydrolase [Deltaproteobacteria bacterium]|nr:CehA/McbA family metallohydrolase [Deltaproteobacteria bacterium]
MLQFASPYYDVWYELLDLGSPIAPTAGTDFPCGPWSVPGAERFYARLPEAPTRRGLVAAVRAGRTFVTNGPLIDLQVGSMGIGDRLHLSEPETVPIRGLVRFDPERDDVKQVELLRNGRAVQATLIREAPGSIRVELDRELGEAAWWALRVSGDKVGAAPVQRLPSGPVIDFLSPRISNFAEHMRVQTAFHEARGRVAASAAHTGPIWVTVGRTQEAERLRAKPRAEDALVRLDTLEQRLSDEQIGDEAIWDWIPYSDGVSVEHLRRNRTALLRAIRHAKERYRQILAYR